MPHRPRSTDRTQSPVAVSQKREYFKHPPETIGIFRLRVVRSWSLEIGGQFEKTRNWREFMRFVTTQSPVFGLVGWGGRIRTAIWRIGNRLLSPVREKPQNLFPLKFISDSKRSYFREPYRIGEVQSFGEKRAFRRIISRLHRSGVQSSNEKSLLLLG